MIFVSRSVFPHPAVVIPVVVYSHGYDTVFLSSYTVLYGTEAALSRQSQPLYG